MKLAPNRWAIVWLWCGASCALAGAATATLQVTADPIQPEGLPVLLTLTVHNSGREPIYFWQDSAGDYPDASHFVATVIGQGRDRTLLRKQLSNSNGPLASGSGRLRRIDRGRSLSFPAALPPLPAGSYRIIVVGEPQGRFAGGQLVDVWVPQTISEPSPRVEIRADEKLAEERDEQIIAKVRTGDPFAEHVAGRYPREAVRDALEQDLSGDDIVAAEGAIDAFWPGRDPPPEAAPTIASAIRSHLKPINDGHDEWMMHQLLGMARQLNTPDVTAAVKELSAARPDGRVRDYAKNAPTQLNYQATPPAHVRLRPEDVFEDPLIDALLKLSQSVDPKTRIRAYKSLSGYPESRRAIEALKKGTLDRDDSARLAAEKGLRTLNADRVWRKLDSVLPETQP
jgi:hypothetical protein